MVFAPPVLHLLTLGVVLALPVLLLLTLSVVFALPVLLLLTLGVVFAPNILLLLTRCGICSSCTSPVDSVWYYQRCRCNLLPLTFHLLSVLIISCFFPGMASLPEACDRKYGDCDDAVTEVSCIALQLRRGGGRQRLPSVLILADCDIHEAGDEEEIDKRCQGVRELDLSKNKLKHWQEVQLTFLACGQDLLFVIKRLQ